MFTLLVWVHVHKSFSLENENHLTIIFSSNIPPLTVFTTSQKRSLSYSCWLLFSFVSQFCFRQWSQGGDKPQALTTCQTTRTRSILITHTIQRLSALGSSPCHQQYHSSVISSKQHCKRLKKKSKKNLYFVIVNLRWPWECHNINSMLWNTPEKWGCGVGWDRGVEGGGGGEDSGPNDSAGGHADWIYNVNWRKKLGIRHIRLGHGAATGGGGWGGGGGQGHGKGKEGTWCNGGWGAGPGGGGGERNGNISVHTCQADRSMCFSQHVRALKISYCWHVNPRRLPYHRKGRNWSWATLIVIRIPMRQSTRNQLHFILGATH